MNNQIIKLPDVVKLSSLSSASIYRLIKKGEFPKQIKLSERSSGWLLSEVEQWLDDKVNAREVNNETSDNQIIKLPAVIKLSALSSATIYRLIKIGEFPKQIKLSERSSGWLLNEVEQWLDDKVNAREVDNETSTQ